MWRGRGSGPRRRHLTIGIHRGLTNTTTTRSRVRERDALAPDVAIARTTRAPDQARRASARAAQACGCQKVGHQLEQAFLRRMRGLSRGHATVAVAVAGGCGPAGPGRSLVAGGGRAGHCGVGGGAGGDCRTGGLLAGRALVRSAVYHAAIAVERRQVHRALAAACKSGGRCRSPGLASCRSGRRARRRGRDGAGSGCGSGGEPWWLCCGGCAAGTRGAADVRGRAAR
jgi:hypothetical protein